MTPFASHSPFLTIQEAAIYLRVSPRTLDAWRQRKIGPDWRKHGGRVFYDINDLNRWSRDRNAPHGA